MTQSNAGIWTVALKQASVAFACCPPLVHNFNISIISADLHGNGTLYDTRKNDLNSILKILWFIFFRKLLLFISHDIYQRGVVLKSN